MVSLKHDAQQPLIELHGISKFFGSGDTQEEILHNINLELYAGEVVAFLGPSGSGKSTLLNILGLLSTHDAGTYTIDGISTAELSPSQTAQLRLQKISFIFQSFHLIDHKNTLENVELPLKYLGFNKQEREEKSRTILEQLGLSHRADAKISTLSGGEKQRVAIARALVTSPKLLLCDEPTGSLDTKRSQEVMTLLKEITGKTQCTVIVTHDPAIAARCDRTISIQDGNLNIESYTVISDNLPIEEKPQPLTSKSWFTLGISEALDATIQRLRRNLFTALGVALGVASLVLTVGLVATISGQIDSAFNVYLARHITLTQSSRQVLTATEALALVENGALGRLENLNGVKSASVIRPLTTGVVTVTAAPETRIDFPGRQQVRVLSATPNIFATQGQKTLSGRTFDQGHIDRHDRVAVASQSLLDNLGLTWTPGLTLYIANTPISVIGVVEENPSLSDFYGALYLPLGLDLEKNAGATIISLATAPGAAAQISKEAPLALSPSQPNSFTAGVPPTAEKLRNAIGQSQSSMLFVLSTVTLIIGAVGIMNTFLVAVIERQKEIGIRLALGMRPGGIITQFVTEAFLTSTFGTLAGIIVAINAIAIVSLINHWTPVINASTIASGLCAGLLVGLLAGIYPAWKASGIDPVETLNG